MILITGTTGMVGHYIDDADWHGEVVKTTRDDFDITDLEQVKRYMSFRSIKYSTNYIVHLAAETDVDLCERNPDHAYLTNTTGTQNMVYMAMQLNVPLLYTSTVGIFGGDGSVGPFTEFDPPYPANVYGMSKLFGERTVRDHLCKYFIIRPGWMMGGGLKKDKKFVGKITRQILDGRKEIAAVSDVIGSPTYAKDLIKNIAALLKTQYWGTYHCTNQDCMSRWDMARLICSELAPKIRVRAVEWDYFDLPAQRAMSECSENKVLQSRGLDMMPDAKNGLRRYLQEIKGEINGASKDK